MIKNGMFNLKQQNNIVYLTQKNFLLLAEWDILIIWIFDETHEGSIF